MPAKFPDFLTPSLPAGMGKIVTVRRALFLALAASLLVFFGNAILSNKAQHPPVASSGYANMAALEHYTEAKDAPQSMYYVASASIGAVPSTDRKLIRTAELQLLVKDVRGSASQIVKLVTESGGQVDSLNIEETDAGCFSGNIVVRVPSNGLEDALVRLKSIAIRTDREHISSRDVTRDFYDNEAHLRNLQAEEQQYLLIMKQSGKISDTLQVAQHLSDVRDRIERQQAAMQVMNHDIEMSQVSITLTRQVETRIAGFEWRPLQNARVAMREVLTGLAEWCDAIVALLIKLPLAAAWTLTVAGVLWFCFLVVRWLWRRVRRLVHAVEKPV